MKTVLVAGIGNILMGDDAFGCEVIRAFVRTPPPEGVDAVDFGIRGVDLGYALMDGYDLAILVDTATRGGTPGSVYVIEPELPEVESGAQQPPLIAPHAMDPTKVLRLVAAQGSRRPRLLLVACEPQYLGGEHGHMGLSDAVAAAVEPAIAEIKTVIDRHRSGNGRRRPATPDTKRNPRLQEA